MTDMQQKVIAACKEKARTAAELVDAFGVSRWYVYQLSRRGFLKNVGNDHNSAIYVASETQPKTVNREPKNPRWKPQNAIEQVTSIWHYAERLK
jgi:hypothetical protein